MMVKAIVEEYQPEKIIWTGIKLQVMDLSFSLKPQFNDSPLSPILAKFILRFD